MSDTFSQYVRRGRLPSGRTLRPRWYGRRVKETRTGEADGRQTKTECEQERKIMAKRDLEREREREREKREAEKRQRKRARETQGERESVAEETYEIKTPHSAFFAIQSKATHNTNHM